MAVNEGGSSSFLPIGVSLRLHSLTLGRAIRNKSNGLLSPVDVRLRCVNEGEGHSNETASSDMLRCTAANLAAEAQSYAPKDGFVPDSTTAVTIAEAVLIPVYGKEKIEAERPFKAVLENGVWTVNGTLHCPDGKGGVTTRCVGGTAEVKLSKADGRIIRMIHYR